MASLRSPPRPDFIASTAVSTEPKAVITITGVLGVLPAQVLR